MTPLDGPVGLLDLIDWDLFVISDDLPPLATIRSVADDRHDLELTMEKLAASKCAGVDPRFAARERERKRAPCIWSHWCPICAMYVERLVPGHFQSANPLQHDIPEEENLKLFRTSPHRLTTSSTSPYGHKNVVEDGISGRLDLSTMDEMAVGTFGRYEGMKDFCNERTRDRTERFGGMVQSAEIDA
ncbi:hypothetical protein PV11_07730 [Exophiala sideris]|uniref:Uncharacterized protein n=1 Tax=Exophiala sideris TaxID=1016849 RepID=A0A0D1YGU0_9EURO|nr:hypothetical protein PV11_07730 [Exophiala sideris]